MENPYKVIDVAREIAQSGITTGVYFNTTTSDVLEVRSVCSATWGGHRRYFTVANCDKAPTIKLIGLSQSKKSIQKVDLDAVVGSVPLPGLVDDGLVGVLRGLRLYLALVELGKLRVNDFMRPPRESSLKLSGGFGTHICHVDTLEFVHGTSLDNQTQSTARGVAKDFKDPDFFAVVTARDCGIAAVYYQGEQVA